MNLISSLGVRTHMWPQDSVGKFIYICHFMRVEINAKKVKKKKKRRRRRKKRILLKFDSKGRLIRCPRRANSYDQMRKSIG